ncbi:MAG: hypothetical protein V4692_02465 [Bdellovibrionota bacterium]
MQAIDALLNRDIEKRDEAWELELLKALPAAPVRVLTPDPQEGPDHWPYLMVSTGEGADDSFANVAGWLSTRGIGCVINPEKPTPDYVLTYGMIWNYRERGEFLTQGSQGAAGRFEFKNGQELMTGVPTEAYFPAYARKIVKQFLADQGVFTPKVLMVSVDKTNYDLCFSIESMKSPPPLEHANIAEALSWFFPAHYSIALVSEKVVAGFSPI